MSTLAAPKDQKATPCGGRPFIRHFSEQPQPGPRDVKDWLRILRPPCLKMMQSFGVPLPHNSFQPPGPGQRLPQASHAPLASHDDLIARLIADHARDGLILQDIRGRIEWANPAYLRMFGRSLSSMVGQNPLSFCLPPDMRPPDAEIAAFRYEPDKGLSERYEIIENIRSNGEHFWNQLSFGVVRIGEGEENTKIIVSCRDVTDQVDTEQALRQAKVEIEHAATHDDLTGLANRKLLKSYLCTPEVLRCLRKGRAGILQLDVDHFKKINDRLGHNAGDAALIHVARQMSLHSGDAGNLACRTGGDEFQLVFLNVESRDDMLISARKLTQAIAEPIHFDGQEIRVSVSIGMALAPPGTDDGLELVKRADQALYQVKHSGRGVPMIFNETLGLRLRERDQLVADLRVALTDGQMQLYYQPQLDLEDNHLVGVEALIRWNHPQRGLLAPAAFLEAAELNHVLTDIDDIAANSALDALATLTEQGFETLKMSINVSGQTLNKPNYPNLLDWTIQERGIDPSRVCIEILETVILRNRDSSTVRAIEALKQLGVGIALDDFGTGYAGLAQLSQFDIDYVKLDRSMIAQLDHSRRNRKIISAIVNLCRDLDIHVVAEGVETARQLQVLRLARCPVIQGYGLARPMPFDRLLPWLRAFQTKAAPFVIAGTDKGPGILDRTG